MEVVNAAGVYADRINNMISPEKFTLVPRRGEYVLLDKTERGFVNSTIFQMPTALGKGLERVSLSLRQHMGTFLSDQIALI